jgi:hypothetical protein
MDSKARIDALIDALQKAKPVVKLNTDQNAACNLLRIQLHLDPKIVHRLMKCAMASVALNVPVGKGVAKDEPSKPGEAPIKKRPRCVYATAAEVRDGVAYPYPQRIFLEMCIFLAEELKQERTVSDGCILWALRALLCLRLCVPPQSVRSINRGYEHMDQDHAGQWIALWFDKPSLNASVGGSLAPYSVWPLITALEICPQVAIVMMSMQKQLNMKTSEWYQPFEPSTDEKQSQSLKDTALVRFVLKTGWRWGNRSSEIIVPLLQQADDSVLRSSYGSQENPQCLLYYAWSSLLQEETYFESSRARMFRMCIETLCSPSISRDDGSGFPMSQSILDRIDALPATARGLYYMPVRTSHSCIVNAVTRVTLYKTRLPVLLEEMFCSVSFPHDLVLLVESYVLWV